MANNPGIGVARENGCLVQVFLKMHQEADPLPSQKINHYPIMTFWFSMRV